MLTIKRVFKNFNTVHLKVNSTAACQSGAKATTNKSEVEREVMMIFLVFLKSVRMTDAGIFKFWSFRARSSKRTQIF